MYQTLFMPLHIYFTQSASCSCDTLKGNSSLVDELHVTFLQLKTFPAQMSSAKNMKIQPISLFLDFYIFNEKKFLSLFIS